MSDDYWRADDARYDDTRYDNARYDRERAYRDRREADEQGWRSLRGGDTLGAIRAVAGAEAAMYYADRTADRTDDGDGSDLGWPPHAIAVDLDEFLENLYALSYPVAPRVAHVDRTQVQVEARDPRDGDAYVGSFFASRRVAAEYLDHTDALVLSDSSERFVRQLRQALS